MSAGTKVIKKTAKTALKDHWCNAIIVCTVLTIVYFLCNLISECLEIVFFSWVTKALYYSLIFFLFMPLVLGGIRYFWRLLFGVSEHPLSLFYYFSDKTLYWRALRLTFSLAIRAAVFGFVVLLPAIITDFLSQASFYEFFHLPIPIWSSGFVYLSTFLQALGKILLFFFLLRYFALPFLVVADEQIEIKEAIRRSLELSRFSSLDPFILILSFLGCLLLCVLAIPVIFVLPYFATALCVQFRFMIAAYNKEADRLNSAPLPTYEVTI